MKRLLAPAFVLAAIGTLAPLAWVLRLSLYRRGGMAGERQYEILFYEPGTWTMENYSQILSEPFYRGTLLFTLGLGVLVTVIAITVGWVLAWGLHSCRPGSRAALAALIVLPKFTNIIVFVFGLKMMFGANGLLPVVGGEVWMLAPYAALTITAALAASPVHLTEAARGLGAGPFAAFWFVSFRLALPGTLAATLMVLVWSLGAFVAPYLLGSPRQYTAGVIVDRLTNSDLNWALAAALDVVLMAVAAALGLFVSRIRRWLR